jgi:hypothetical protein
MFAHRLFGLPAPHLGPPADDEALRPGAIERLVRGPVMCVLVPRALDEATV